MRTRAVLVGTGVVVAALGVVFLAVGLGTADQVASAVGALAGVAGLGFAIASWANGRGGGPAPGPSRTTIQGAQFGHHHHQENTFVSGRAWFGRRRRRDDDD
jgi:hypothetical protein